MTCARCAARVERALAGVPGVASVRVSASSGRAVVEGTATTGTLVRAVESVGYGASPATVAHMRDRIEARRRERREEAEAWKRRSWAALLALPVIAISMAPMAGYHVPHGGLLEAIIATVALLVIAPPFYRRGLPDLLKLRFDMDSMVALGTLVAYLASVFELFSGGHHLYFEDSVAVLAFMTLGRYLEARSKDRASSAVEGLVDLLPPMARRLEDGAETEVPTDLIAPGQRVVIRPGEKATVDGVVVEGRAAADESVLTGESMPVEKGPGSKVIAGSLVHGGRLVVEAERTGEETSLGEILRELESIAEKRTGYQDFADRVIGFFMPVVLATAAVTFAGWWIVSGDVLAALRPTVAVLVIACPCAIGIAIPVAVSVGAGAAARRGLLIRDPTALDRIPGIRVFVFDKTGSVTEARMRVGAVRAPGGDPGGMIRLAATVESASEHPIARAIVEAAGPGFRPGAVEEFRAEPGLGVEGRVEGRKVRIGRLEWIAPDLDGGEREWIAARAGEGMTVFAAAVEGKGPADRVLIAVEDALRPEAPEAVMKIRKAGYRTVLLTGDRAATAEAVGRRCGFDEVRAEMLPAEKARAVEELRARHGGVAMLGDGVNDAPALAASDIGVAMASGSGLAFEAGHVALTRPDLRLLPELLVVGRAIRRKAHENLFWAFAYNVVLIPAAAFGVATPMMAAVAMGLSDVTVVLNAMRLWRFATPRS